jgi:hypothetical protein
MASSVVNRVRYCCAGPKIVHHMCMVVQADAVCLVTRHLRALLPFSVSLCGLCHRDLDAASASGVSIICQAEG